MSEDLKRDYDVGYGKPPKHSRFKPGQSANPAGRKKGVANFKTDLKNTLQLPVQLTEAGKTKRVSTQQAALSRLKQKALTGDDERLMRRSNWQANSMTRPEAWGRPARWTPSTMQS